MPRYIDADKLFEFIQKEKAWKQDTMRRPRYDQWKYDAYYEMLEIIQQQPTVDAAPVVRCRECKYLHTTALTAYCPIMNNYPAKDFYCGAGERKDETK